MTKHAYLIMAHNEFSLLRKLILLLDDSRNDIFIHVDKKSKEFVKSSFMNLPTFSKVSFIKSDKVTWGGYSLINCELKLLIEASNSFHDYYHLLSGVDLPLKTQNEIHSFFELHQGEVFIFFDLEAIRQKNFLYRMKYFYPFQEFIGHNTTKSGLYQLNRIILRFQMI